MGILNERKQDKFCGGGLEIGTLFLFYNVWFHMCMKFYVPIYMAMYSVDVPPPIKQPRCKDLSNSKQAYQLDFDP